MTPKKLLSKAQTKTNQHTQNNQRHNGLSGWGGLPKLSKPKEQNSTSKITMTHSMIIRNGPKSQTCSMRLMKFVPQRHTAALSHHHYPNVLFHLWHHPQLSTTPSPPSSPGRWRKPFAWCAVSVWGCRPTRCGRWLIPVCSLTPFPLCSVSSSKG